MNKEQFYSLKMHQYFPEEIQSANFRIKTFNVNQDQVDHHASAFDWIKEKDFVSEGTYTVLTLMDYYTEVECVMSDFHTEKETNWEFVQQARGNVLIGGLGLGMVVLAIQGKPEVKSVTIIEKEKHIIRMVKPRVPFNEKVQIINQNVFAGLSKKFQFDTIYFDIWNTICGTNVIEMSKLEKKYRKNLRNGGWMDGWAKKECVEGVKKQDMELGKKLEEFIFQC